MPDVERAVEAHYARGGLGEAILAALSRARKDLENLRRKILHRSTSFISEVERR